MTFSRIGSTDYYEAPGGKAFVFCPGHNQAGFDLTTAFTPTNTRNFVLGFYSGSFSESATSFWKGKVSSARWIYWVNAFTVASLSEAASMRIESDRVREISNINFASAFGEYSVFVTDGNVVSSTISFDTAAQCLKIRSGAGQHYDFVAHSIDGDPGSGASFNEAFIPLTHRPEPFASKLTKVTNNFGSFYFQNAASSSKKLLQPVTPYLLKTADFDEVALPSMFEDNDFSQNVETVVTLFPYKHVSNTDDDPLNSHAEFFVKKETSVRSKFAGDKGDRFKATEFASLPCILCFTESVNSDPDSRRFFFTPKHDSQLRLKVSAGNDFFLLGQSGTEAIKSDAQAVTLTFKKSNELLLDDGGDGSEEQKFFLATSGNSRTAKVKVSGDQENKYFADPQKAPSFVNAKQSAVANGNIQVAYAHLDVGNLGEAALPLIPTMSIQGDQKLQRLERIFSGIRMQECLPQSKKLALGKTVPFITPQGFIIDGDQYDFIKPEGLFRCRITCADEHLRLSLSKDEVFFILTPELARKVRARIEGEFKIEVLLELEKFRLNMMDLYRQASTPGSTELSHKECILIVKFHHGSLRQLINDRRTWTNFGHFDPRTDSTAMQEAINRALDEAIHDDYLAALEKDPAWTGVLMLNIPLGGGDEMDPVFDGLTGSQKLKDEKDDEDEDDEEIDRTPKVKFATKMKYQYMAFPVNKTEIKDGAIGISKTALYGMIDYNPLRDAGDYELAKKYFTETTQQKYRFLLTKLFVQFRNSSISNFQSNAFVKAKELFEESDIVFEGTLLNTGDTHPSPAKIEKLAKLGGLYQKNENKQPEFVFFLESDIAVKFNNSIIDKLMLTAFSFSYTGNSPKGKGEFRFDINCTVHFAGLATSFFSFRSLEFRNVGLKFQRRTRIVPNIKFDLSRLLVLPDIAFDSKGFLSSFPIRFSRFKSYAIELGKVVNFDFNVIKGVDLGSIDAASLFSFIFDFDLGTLGNLGALKALKGELLIGWCRGKGIQLGFRLAGSGSQSVDLDLFGALKVTVRELSFGTFMPAGHTKCDAYFLRLNDARIKFGDTTLPKEENEFYGLLIVSPEKGDKKIAWLINYAKAGEHGEMGPLVLGLGQRVGIDVTLPPLDPPMPGETGSPGLVARYIKELKGTFAKNLKDLPACPDVTMIPYNPKRNWLVASEDILPDAWKSKVDLKFIFNDPAVYGLYLQLVGLFSIDILYRKLSDSLGVWSMEFALDPSLRTVDMGGATVTFPNLGVDIYTNGDWKGDIGFPVGSDYSRSCLIQVLPFVGWGGFYLMKSRNASLTLFHRFINDAYSQEHLLILQAGLAIRIGLGKYISKGPLYLGASISVFGILEGAFAFEKGESGADKFLPDHFALFGRCGIIAEFVGYVDFKIVKAAIHLILKVEAGVKMVYLSRDVPGQNTGRGLQPIYLYIEGTVSVSVTVRIACFKIWRKRICIYITFRFRTSIRLDYVLGKNNNNKQKQLDAADAVTLVVPVNIEQLPVTYIPAIAKESGKVFWVHNFAMPFFYVKKDGDKFIAAKENILTNKVLKPVFDALTLQGIKNYEDLRLVLQQGIREDGSKVELEFNTYMPAFHIDRAFNDPELLKTVYGFTDQEIIFFNAYHSQPANACDAGEAERQNCVFRMIPLPMTAKVIMNTASGAARIETPFSSVKIELEGFLNTSYELTDKLLPESYLDTVDAQFADYRTQFSERNKFKSEEKVAEEDLRRKHIVPDFFRMFALMALEGYINTLSDDDRQSLAERKKEVNIAALLEFCTANMDELIGKVNMFYSSGLRLSDPAGTGTLSYYSLLDQVTAIGTIDTAAPFGTAHIKINGQDIKDDMFGDEASYRSWVNELQRKALADPAALASQFGNMAAKEPYELRPFAVAVAASRLKIASGQAMKPRFFAIPDVLRRKMQEPAGAGITYSLFVGKNGINHLDDNAEKPLPLNFVPVANVSLQVKPHDKKVVEMVNVHIDDLVKMVRIREQVGSVQKVQIYVKQEVQENPNDANKTAVYTEITSDCRLVKTNLSTKTHPPVILDQAFKEADVVQKTFIASKTEHAAFARLLWEAMATNQGGYFMVFEKEETALLFEGQVNPVIMVSFAFAENNAVAIADNLIITGSDDFYKQLEQGNTYIFADKIKLGTKDVLEYHTKIPAHCMSFELVRTLPPAGSAARLEYETRLGQYIPLEYEVKDSAGKVLISKDGVLPIMPQEGATENVQVYKHVTPLVPSAKGQPDRYKIISKKFTAQTALRDVYGFRGTNVSAPLTYEALYFDKLIPLESWPLLKFSYWFDRFDGNTAHWKLRCRLDVQSLNTGGQSSFDETSSNMLEQLYTIEAQLADDNVTVTFNGGTVSKLKEFLQQRVKLARETVEAFRAFLLQSGQKPEPDQVTGETLDFTTAIDPTGIKTELHFKIDIARKQTLCIHNATAHAKLQDDNIWGYDQVGSTGISLKAENPDNKPGDQQQPADYTKTSMIVLNALILKSSNDKYVLGLSANEKQERVMYLINRTMLQSIKPKNTTVVTEGGNKIHEFSTKNYFGIRPFSNKLWSGSYTSQSTSVQQFTNIDLDKSLRIVLDKLDVLLNAASLSSRLDKDNQQRISNLIAAKEQIVNKELVQRLDWVMEPGTVAAHTQEEFRNILLKQVNNFYAYDGIIRSDAGDVKGLKDHRLTISTGQVPKYNLVSSKIHFTGSGDPEWSILFDQRPEEQGSVSFDFKTNVTHIECNIQPPVGDTNIELSTWIQLVSPVELIDGRVKKWPLVIREFPPRPVMLKQTAVQLLSDEAAAGKIWDPATMGNWLCDLRLKKDTGQQVGDEMHVNLQLITATFKDSDAGNDINGFLAYWAGVISRESSNGFDWQQFADDLAGLFTIPLAPKMEADVVPMWNFILKKMDAEKWEIRYPEGSLLKNKVSFTTLNATEQKAMLAVNIGPFNIFDKSNPVTSVLSEVKLLRNADVNNPLFKYETETVKAASQATPQIRYTRPIPLKQSGTFVAEVYSKIPTALPYKSTAKFLLKTGPVESNNLAERPVMQIEVSAAAAPVNADALFTGYATSTDGFAAISVTIHDQNENAPIFYAANLYRVKM